VLGRPAPSENRDAETAHVVFVVLVLLVVGVVLLDDELEGGVYCPITMVTVEPFLAVLFGPGLWEMTTPFCFLFFTGWLCWATLKPAARSCPAAPAADCPVTPGTVAVAGGGGGGALAITRLTVVP
jgi:hypothetical protein